MRIHEPLDDVLKRPSTKKVVRFLVSLPEGEWSGLEIARNAGVNHMAGHRALRVLEEHGIVVRRRIGSAFAYRLVKEHVLIPLMEGLFASENGVAATLAEIIRSFVKSHGLREQVLSVTIFGSVARKQETARGDIDLFVVVRAEKARSQVEELFVGPLSSEVGSKFGSPLAPMVYTRTRVRQLRREKNALISNVEKEGKTVFGSPVTEIR